MALTLPVDGQLNWGDELNAAIIQADNDALAAQTLINNHAQNSPADPHGDRAFAQSLVTPLTSGTNQANGFVKLNGSGFIPSNLINGGFFTNVYDVVSTFGALNNGSATAVQIQNALNAAASAGGGIVWIPDGVYGIDIPLIMGNGTWLMMSAGATLRRVSGASIPSWMITNFAQSNLNLVTPNTGPFIVSGGNIDAVGSSLTGSCIPIMFIQSTKTTIRDLTINAVANNPAIEINGCNNTYLENITFSGSTSGSPSAPAIRLNTTATGITPANLPAPVYNNAPTNNTVIIGCSLPGTGVGPWPFGSLIGTDLTTAGQVIDFVNIRDCRAPDLALAPIVPNNWSNFASALNRIDGFPSGGFYVNSARDFVFSGLSNTGVPAPITIGVLGNISYATGGSISSEPQLETWHSMPAMSAGWNVGGHARYRLTALGDLQVAFKDMVVGTSTDQTVIWAAGSLPPAYRPTNNHRIVCYADQLRVSGSGFEAACLEFQTDGSVQCIGIAGGASRADCYAIIPITDPP